MSGTQRLYPNVVTVPSGGTASYFINQAGSSVSANLCASLKDDDTTTYVRTTSINGMSRFIAFDNMTALPTDARITKLQPFIKGKTFNANSGGYFGGYVRLGTAAAPSTVVNQAPYMYRWVDYKTYPTLAGPVFTTNHKGEALTPSIVNTVDMYIATVRNASYNSWQQTTMRITEWYIDVSYDEKPITSSVAAYNTADTLRPLIGWDYTDDLQPQVKAQVQIIRVSNGQTVYDSGEINTGDSFFEIPRNLTIGVSYYARVRTAQYWSLPGGTFWSDWATSSNFSITVTPPPRATLSFIANGAGAYNTVTANVSSWGSEFKDGSTYVAIQGLDVPGFMNITPSAWSSLPGTNPSLYAAQYNIASAKWSEGNAGIANPNLNDWKFIEAKIVPNGASSVEFHDYTAKAGVPRIYRTYTYKYNSTFGFLLTNQDTTYSYPGYAPQQIDMDAAWLSAVEPDINLTTGAVIDNEYNAHQFMYTNASSNGGEQYTKEAKTFEVAGRDYPVADFGTGEQKTVSVTIQLYDAVDREAFRTLDKRKCPIVFRDWRGQRIKGIMNGVQYTDTKWGQEVSFSIIATGEQFT